MAKKRTRKNPAAVALGRRRMKKLSDDERTKFAKEGGKARAKSRFEGWTKEQISEEMKRIRGAAKAKKR
jgi:hypothetical protein